MTAALKLPPAYSGDAAIKIIQENCPDVVLTDVVMPGVNGVEVAKFVADNCSDTRSLTLFRTSCGLGISAADKRVGILVRVTGKTASSQ